jgi:hypothetical protein
LGILSKDMPDIRNENFKTKEKNIWALKANIEEDSSVIVLYSETDENKYMIAGLKNDKIPQKMWFCIICGDCEEENPELNRIFIINENKSKITIREANIIEMANILITFECFRNFSNGWFNYEPEISDYLIIKKFTNSISEEEI